MTDCENHNDLRRIVANKLANVSRDIARRRMLAGRGRPVHDPDHGQGRVLALLKLKPDTTQRDLTFLTGTTRQGMSETLSRLERRGLITREPTAEHRKIMRVRLTAAGHATEQVRPEGRISQVLGVLNDDEVAVLADMLSRIEEKLRDEK